MRPGGGGGSTRGQVSASTEYQASDTLRRCTYCVLWYLISSVRDLGPGPDALNTGCITRYSATPSPQ